MNALVSTVRIQPFRVAGYGLAVTALLWVGLNALAFQDARHPSPWSFAWDRLAIGPAEPAPIDARLVADTQQALFRHGYYTGPIDGVFSPATEDAILRFEQATGRPITGTPSATLLAVLGAAPEPRDIAVQGAEPARGIGDLVNAQPGLGQTGVQAPPAVSQPTTSQAAPSAVGDVGVAYVQQLLADVGYPPGVVDGLMGPATRGAIEAFQRDRGLPVTGAIDDRLVGALESAL